MGTVVSIAVGVPEFRTRFGAACWWLYRNTFGRLGGRCLAS